MTPQGAEKAVTTSALVIAGIYIYRRLTEGSGSASGSKAAQLLGQGSPPSVGTFVTAWGAAFLIISIVASASPGLGGGFAILAATGDILSNGQQVFSDVNNKISASSSVKATAAGASAGDVASVTGSEHYSQLTLVPPSRLAAN